MTLAFATIWKHTYSLLIIGLILLQLAACSSSSSEKSSLKEQDQKVQTTKDTIAQRPVHYQLISIKDTNEWLKSLPAGDTLNALLALNRIDRNNLYRLDSLIFPDTIGQSIDLYSPFPEKVETLKAVKKILLVSHYVQAFAVYENGLRIKWGPASLGKESSPTPTGLFATNWKSKKTTSTVNSDWVMEWYFNLANFEGVSMHEYALPGFPASHACIRLYREDAIWLYHWADQWIIENSQIEVYGTPVVIFGSYPFDKGKPWLLLPKNNKALEISSSELHSELEEFLPTIMERQSKRDSLIN